MAFINERISPEDAVKYRVEEINSLVIGKNFSCDDWTIDREREMYLREVDVQVEDDHCPTGLSRWVFFWKGNLFWVEIKSLESRGHRDGPGWAKERIVEFGLMGNNEFHIGMSRPTWTHDLLEKKNEIIADVYSALLAYKDGGIWSSSTTYELVLEVDEGVWQ